MAVLRRKPGGPSSTVFINGYHYPSHGPSHRIRVGTVVPRGAQAAQETRYPMVENILAIGEPGYRVRDCLVTVRMRHAIERFLISFVFSQTFPVNDSLGLIAPNIAWNGEIVVMQSSCLEDTPAVFGMRGTEAEVKVAADRAASIMWDAEWLWPKLEVSVIDSHLMFNC
ncbi:hypothetical protein BV25DRAFT_1922627 [Artomyces pyxidatus]|uniref:Uncharacterized protein n=1 Tax=Artomyces pyxidatus TaxID=48021 RepID=A0ACB8SFF7_9AGAM|nr:hypothetical protein BV25DRAFT_1922627 [Artomyces pyxidatus]